MNFDPLNDGISSVELLTNMGDDIMVVNAARVSMALSIITLTGPDDPAVQEHGLRTVPTVIVQYPDGATARFTGNKPREYIESVITESNL